MKDIVSKYYIRPIYIVDHFYNNDKGLYHELLIVKMRAHRYNKLYRFMFCNANDVVLDATIPASEMHDPSLFLKYFCNALSSQSVCYGQQDSIFAYNFATDSAVMIVQKEGPTRYFMYDWVYNDDINKNELKLREIVNGKEVPLKETVIQEIVVNEYEQIVKCLEKNGIEVYQYVEDRDE